MGSPPSPAAMPDRTVPGRRPRRLATATASSQPVLDGQLRDSCKLPLVVGHQGVAEGNRLRDDDVEIAQLTPPDALRIA